MSILWVFSIFLGYGGLCWAAIVTKSRQNMSPADALFESSQPGNRNKVFKFISHSGQVGPLNTPDLFTEWDSGTWSSCPPYDSCFDPNRPLDSKLSPLQMSSSEFEKTNCFCDSDCIVYGDCCEDAEKNHTLLGPGSLGPKQWGCETLPGSKQHFYVVNTCPSDWSDEEVYNRCRRKIPDWRYTYWFDLPVLSKRTNRIYTNVHCAACHSDMFLVPLNLTLRCSVENCSAQVPNATYIPGQRKWSWRQEKTGIELTAHFEVDEFSNWETSLVSFKPRKCKPVTMNCKEKWKNETIAKLCQTMPVSYRYSHVGVGYKNPYCAICNFQGTLLKCTSGPGPTRFKIFPIHDIPIWSESATYSMLMDFYNKNGGYVGAQDSRCPEGQLYDALYKRCKPYICGKLYRMVKGRCVKINDKPQDSASNDTITSNCYTETLNKVDVHLLPNGYIYINNTKRTYSPGQFEYFNDTVVLVCSSVHPRFAPKFSAVQSRLSTISLCISLVCLAAHITVHALVAKLRNLPGKNLLSLSIALFFAQFLFFFGITRTNFRGLCIGIGVVMHFCFLVSFFWMNVMAVDICRTFTSEHCRPSTKAAQNRTFCRYSMYAWLVPALIVGLALLIDNTEFLEEIQPRYGHHICWISRRRGLLVFFIVPLAALLLENTAFFVLTARGIHRTSQVARGVARRSSDLVRFYLYVKLAFIMGLTWVLGFVAAMAEFEPLWYVFIVLNALQGAFIFVAFSLKRKVFHQLMERITGRRLRTFDRAGSGAVRNSQSARSRSIALQDSILTITSSTHERESLKS